mmetsp:Transcript_178231/g.571318  ORF Transcript_178231/g.571318 Transcript_178231/m.571318 type:complete len:250 (+) Transcript_178231:46-795(+)
MSGSKVAFEVWRIRKVINHNKPTGHQTVGTWPMFKKKRLCRLTKSRCPEILPQDLPQGSNPPHYRCISSACWVRVLHDVWLNATSGLSVLDDDAAALGRDGDEAAPRELELGTDLLAIVRGSEHETVPAVLDAVGALRGHRGLCQRPPPRSPPELVRGAPALQRTPHCEAATAPHRLGLIGDAEAEVREGGALGELQLQERAEERVAEEHVVDPDWRCHISQQIPELGQMQRGQWVVAQVLLSSPAATI